VGEGEASRVGYFNRGGRAHHLRGLRGGVRRAVATAGLKDETLTPHSLRHGFGSIMLALGHATKTVSNWLGHIRVSTPERWYVHQIEAMQDEAGDRMRAQMDARRGRLANAGAG
jgi:site-specific recombinase XerD